MLQTEIHNHTHELADLFTAFASSRTMHHAALHITPNGDYSYVKAVILDHQYVTFISETGFTLARIKLSKIEAIQTDFAGGEIKIDIVTRELRFSLIPLQNAAM